MPLKWGLIGCGDISRKRVAPALRDLPNCDLVAVSRANFEQAESFAKEFGARKWYRDWTELIADEEVEAVYIATPVRLHAEQTIAAHRSLARRGPVAAAPRSRACMGTNVLFGRTRTKRCGVRNVSRSELRRRFGRRSAPRSQPTK